MNPLAPDVPVIPVKWFETQSYVRIAEDGKPQLIVVAPVFIAPNHLSNAVQISIDDVSTATLDRSELAQYLDQLNCRPLALILNHRHKIKH